MHYHILYTTPPRELGPLGEVGPSTSLYGLTMPNNMHKVAWPFPPPSSHNTQGGITFFRRPNIPLWPPPPFGSLEVGPGSIKQLSNNTRISNCDRGQEGFLGDGVL